MDQSILEHLVDLYGEAAGRETALAVEARLARFALAPAMRLNHTDAVLITYGDQFRPAQGAPLAGLRRFCDEFLKGAISGVHILPFFPYTSDDGFSVSDYDAVDPALGTWEDVEALGRSFRLMVDLVLNHCSSQHRWFQGFLSGDPRYRDYFITVEPGVDLSRVTRPRALPLLTPYETSRGPAQVWTTFSADQVDLNFANPAVLLEMLDVLLNYLARGARIIRLDAIAYLWKTIGTNCVHLPRTHRVVRLFRAVLERAAPGTLLLTETNVPHRDNLSYFGDGHNEAHLVYNFALPPLTLHTLQTGDARALTEWAAGLDLPGPETTFFNFLASHDGVGVNPARGLLSDAEVEALIARVLRVGGLASYKNNPDGTRGVYELNVNYLDALRDPAQPENLALARARFMAAQFILLSLKGAPGIYVHSLLGSTGWPEGARQTGHNRAINREKFELEAVSAELRDPRGPRGQIFAPTLRLLRARAQTPAFDPYGGQRVLAAHPGAFALLREAGGQRVLACVNVTGEAIELRPDLTGRWRNLLDASAAPWQADQPLRLEAYQFIWLEKME